MIQPAPRDDEHLAKNVVGRCHVRSTPRVSQHRRGVLREEQLNPRPPIGLRNPHTDTMSAAAYEITPGAESIRGRSHKERRSRYRWAVRRLRHPLKTTVAPCAFDALTLTEIFEAFNSLLLSTSRSTALSFVTRTVRFVSATRFEPW